MIGRVEIDILCVQFMRVWVEEQKAVSCVKSGLSRLELPNLVSKSSPLTSPQLELLYLHCQQRMQTSFYGTTSIVIHHGPRRHGYG